MSQQLLEAITKLSQDSEGVADGFDQRVRVPGIFIRLNVERGLDRSNTHGVPMDRIATHTRAYMQGSGRGSMQTAAANLRLPPNGLTTLEYLSNGTLYSPSGYV